MEVELDVGMDVGCGCWDGWNVSERYQIYIPFDILEYLPSSRVTTIEYFKESAVIVLFSARYFFEKQQKMPQQQQGVYGDAAVSSCVGFI